ncbi:hypothetical protein NIBR502773_03245 [Pseudomonas sp. NIBRBAC000502773]|uniref:Uncharacterized protein n=1 Tax=Pseudomonas fluorescens TaxID=294 RepID=A0A7Z6MRD7_PSEFL|nr:hypothetical protein NIBR502773_03245 [Pseudomonas sp. NIBRBAC000502773]RDS87551.1 hypothetical protein DL347_29710 [Pseudomonas fluorescens]
MRWAGQIVVSRACRALNRPNRERFVSGPILNGTVASVVGDPGRIYIAYGTSPPQLYRRVAQMKHPIRAQIFVQVICLLSVAQLFC